MAEYIEREDLEFPYMTMTLWGLNHETCHAYNEGVKAAADYIASLPAADVAPVVHGRWLITKEYNDVIDMDVVKYTCSVCKEYRLTATGLSQATNYCPMCGARMDGE